MAKSHLSARERWTAARGAHHTRLFEILGIETPRSHRQAPPPRRAPGAAILIAAGFHTSEAIAFGLAAQAVIIIAGTAVFAVAELLHSACHLGLYASNQSHIGYRQKRRK